MTSSRFRTLPREYEAGPEVVFRLLQRRRNWNPHQWQFAETSASTYSRWRANFPWNIGCLYLKTKCDIKWENSRRIAWKWSVDSSLQPWKPCIIVCFVGEKEVGQHVNTKFKESIQLCCMPWVFQYIRLTIIRVGLAIAVLVSFKRHQLLFVVSHFLKTMKLLFPINPDFATLHWIYFYFYFK